MIKKTRNRARRIRARGSTLWEPLRLEPELKKTSKSIYTNFEDRGGPMFRVKNTLEAEGSESPNQRVKTRGQILVGGGGAISPKFGKLGKLGQKW